MAARDGRPPYPRLAKSLLWIDCLGGLAVGVLVTVLSAWLSALYALPESLILALGAANLAWACFCVGASAFFASQASSYGLALLLFEGAYVGALGLLEWRFLDALGTAA